MAGDFPDRLPLPSNKAKDQLTPIRLFHNTLTVLAAHAHIQELFAYSIRL
jgi:hypothetical protein